MQIQTHTMGIIELIQRGGVHPRIEGTTSPVVLSNFIEKLTLPPKLSRERLLQAVLEREILMPTAVGHGIALPHPKNPLAPEPQEQLVAIGFLSQVVDWQALDREPVHTVILILSASVKLHLNTLSWINFLCQQRDFQNLLKNQTPQEQLIKMIQGFITG